MSYTPTYIIVEYSAGPPKVFPDTLRQQAERINGELDKIAAALASLSGGKAGFDYARTGLTGGTDDDLDGVDGADLAGAENALVIVGDNEADVFVYTLDPDSGAAEDVPHVIAPDSNPGDKRWILAGRVPRFGSVAGSACEGNDSRLLTADQVAAAAGSSGTPSAANRFVTEEEFDGHADASAPHSGHALSADLSSHINAAAPHNGHALDSDLDAHTNAAAPHTGHALSSDLSTHTGAAAPHTGHEATANKGSANGYAELDVDSLVPVNRLGNGTAGAGKYLTGERSWQDTGGLGAHDVVGGRLERTSATELRWEFHSSNQILLWDGTIWQVLKLAAEPTAANTATDLGGDTLTHGVVYDVFGKRASATSMSLHLAPWAAATQRYSTWAEETAYQIGDRVNHGSNYYACILAHTSDASAEDIDEPGTGSGWQDHWSDLGTDSRCLVRHDGIQVFAGNAAGSTSFDGREYRFLGIIRLSDNSGTAEFRDTKSQRLICNRYNPILKELGVDNPYSGATSFTPADGALTRWEGDITWLFEFLSDGQRATQVNIEGARGTGNTTIFGVVYNATSRTGTANGQRNYCYVNAGINCADVRVHSEGYHYGYPAAEQLATTSVVTLYEGSNPITAYARVTGAIWC